MRLEFLRRASYHASDVGVPWLSSLEVVPYLPLQLSHLYNAFLLLVSALRDQLLRRLLGVAAAFESGWILPGVHFPPLCPLLFLGFHTYFRAHT